MIDDLAAFLDAVGGAQSVHEVRARLGRLSRGLGFGWTFLGWLRVDQASGLALPEGYDTDLPAFGAYLGSGLYRRDPFFPASFGLRHPLVKGLDRTEWGAMAPGEEEVFEGALSRTFATRIMTPAATGRNGVRWIAGFSADRPMAEAEASLAASALWFAAAIAGERLVQLAPGEPPGEVLFDPREREALLRLAAGQGLGGAAERLQLGEAEMSALILRAGRKLGARTVPELVGRALARGLVEP